MTAAIDEGTGHPYPPPPPEWRPGRLTRADEAPLERALYTRVRRVAKHFGISLVEAADLVRRELEGSVAP